MPAHVTTIFLLVSILSAQAVLGYPQAASPWNLKHWPRAHIHCNSSPNHDWTVLSSADKHGEMVTTLDANVPSLKRLFHSTLYQIPEVIETFSVLKKVSSCICAVKDETALCNELQMNQIPSCVGKSTLAAILISRKISKIKASTFNSTPNLEYLNITRIDLRVELPNDTFSGLNKLKHLALQDHGSMPALSEDIFKGLGRLESLYLHNNGLQFLPPKIFAPLRRLRVLNLAGNNLRRLPTGIFDNNWELRELILNGNHLKDRYNPNLLSHNSELRVLLLRDTYSSEINTMLLENAIKLRWLDLSDNYLRQLPAEALKYCQKLSWLSLTGNKFENIDAKLLLQHNSELQRLDLRGNEWNCSCGITALAGWALANEKTVSGMPLCQQPPAVAGIPLQEWFCSHGNVCNNSELQNILGMFIGLTEAIADINNYTEPDVSQFVTSCFFFHMSSELGSSIDLVIARFIYLLDGIFQSKHGRNSSLVEPFIDTMLLARQEPTLKFSYIFQNIPDNMQASVNAALEAEINTIFDLSTAQGTDSIRISDADIVVGLRYEFQKIISVLRNCSFPSTTEIKVEAAPQSSTVMMLSDIYLYSCLAALLFWM